MKKAAVKSVFCAGCEKSLDRFVMTDLSYEIAPGTKVPLCRGRIFSRASTNCLGKALAKAQLCPGCGKKDNRPGSVCADCTDNIRRGKTQHARKLEWWGIKVHALGPYLSFHKNGDWVIPLLDLAKLLGEALTTGRVVQSRSDEAPSHSEVKGVFPNVPTGTGSEIVYVELAEGQGEALHRLCTEIRRVMRLEYQNGWNNGDSLLRRLATGDKGIREYHDSHNKGALTDMEKLDENDIEHDDDDDDVQQVGPHAYYAPGKDGDE